jgi:type I restriction enzyme M protein
MPALKESMAQNFPDCVYVDVPGLCKVATLGEIEEQSWSLNPGRYVGVAANADDGIDFAIRLEELDEELQKLNSQAAILQERISDNVVALLESS